MLHAKPQGADMGSLGCCELGSSNYINSPYTPSCVIYWSVTATAAVTSPSWDQKDFLLLSCNTSIRWLSRTTQSSEIPITGVYFGLVLRHFKHIFLDVRSLMKVDTGKQSKINREAVISQSAVYQSSQNSNQPFLNQS